jgi:hypothetical protein
MRYEIFSESDGFRWRFVDLDGAVLAASSQPLSCEECMREIQIMQTTMDAPVVVLQEPPHPRTELVGESHA